MDINAILEANKDKDFVKRILKPEDYPDLDLGEGMRGTHMISSGGVGNGESLVYPEIIHENGKLRRLSRDEAFDHAVKTGEHIRMKDADAVHFGENYKSAWANHPEERFRSLAPENQNRRKTEQGLRMSP